MTTRRSILLAPFAGVWLTLTGCMSAQKFKCRHPYSEEEIEVLLRSGEPEDSIRERARRCGIFSLRPDAESWLRKLGASGGLVRFLQNQRPNGDTLPTIVMEGSTTIGQPLRPDGSRSLAEDLVRGWLTKGEGTTVPHGSSDGQTTYVSAVMPDGRLQRVTILALGTRYAFIGLRSNADIGLASRPILDNEAAEFLRDGEDMRSALCEKTLSEDAVAIVVADNIVVPTLSRQQVRGVFGGLIAKWSEIAGSGSSDPIRVVARREGAGTLDVFREAFMELGGRTTGFTVDAKYVDGSEDISEYMRTPNSIGFVSFVYARGNANPHGPRAIAISDTDIQTGGRVVPLRAVAPEADTIAAELYPASRRVLAYVHMRPQNPRVAKAVDFFVSEDGQRITAEHGFISQDVRVMPSSQWVSYPDMVTGEERLSVNIHFRTSSNQLDSKAEADLERLIRYIGESKREGRTVLVRGNSDSSGSPTANELLALDRGQSVHRALASAARRHGVTLRIDTRGYSCQFPIASNQYGIGRFKNRRAEIALT
jgi:phosphate transport system substrate-binding protein